MKPTALFIFLLLCISSSAQLQFTKTDVSISSITLDSYDPNAPRTLVIKNNSEIAQPDPNVKFSLPEQPKPQTFFLKCTVVVHNSNDDLAYDTKVIVVLPAQGVAQSISPNATTHKIDPTSPYVSFIEYDLGQMAKNETKSLQFIYQRSTTVPNRVSAYIYSTSSDTNPGNNYKDGSY